MPDRLGSMNWKLDFQAAERKSMTASCRPNNKFASRTCGFQYSRSQASSSSGSSSRAWTSGSSK